MARDELQVTNIRLTKKLLRCLAMAKGKTALAPFVEAALWRTKAVREAAEILGITPPERPTKGRPVTSAVKRVTKKRRRI